MEDMSENKKNIFEEDNLYIFSVKLISLHFLEKILKNVNLHSLPSCLVAFLNLYIGIFSAKYFVLNADEIFFHS